MTENDVRTLKGLAQGAANLKIQTHPLFRSPSMLDNAQLTELSDNFQIMTLFLQEKYGFDPAAARQRFIKLKAETFQQYYNEKLREFAENEKTAKLAIEEGKRLVIANLVPFVDGKRVHWNERLIDGVTQQETPDILTMVFEVAPSLGNIDCITRSDRYMKWLISDFAEHPLIYRYERELSLTQKEQNEKGNAEVVIICKPVLLK